MAVKSISAAVTASLPSGKTLGDLKALVAAVVGGRDRADEVETTNAIRLAQAWLFEVPWEFQRGSATFATVAGTATYALPSRTMQIHNVRVTTGDGRPIKFISRDLYNSQVWNQTNGRFTHYTLEDFGQNTNITLLPTPDAVETVRVYYFTDPAKSVNDSDVVDIAEYMELPLVLYAQGLVAQWRGKAQSWINTQFALADNARRGAQAREIHYDEDVRFQSAYEHGAEAVSLDVAPSYYERFVW